MTKTFYFTSLDSPTHFNLAQHLLAQGFAAATLPSQANFSEENLIIDEEAAQHLEFKHLLAQLVAQYCPEVMPVTFTINDDNCFAVIDAIAKSYYQTAGTLLDNISDLVWILKPSLLNNGAHIKIFDRLSDLRKHYCTTQRLGGEHVLQRYINQPHLLNGHKYTFRMYTIFTNYTGVFLYRRGYFNVSRQTYNKEHDFNDLRYHLTNEHLAEDEPNVIQIPTDRCPNFDVIYQKMKAIITKVAGGFAQMDPEFFKTTKKSAFNIFGYDFILDHQFNLWLLEVNYGPCFPKNEPHILKQHLFDQFWHDVVRSFAIPIAKDLPYSEREYSGFERINLL